MLLVFKERLERGVDEAILRSRQLGKEAGLKKEGKPYFEEFIRDYKNGQRIEFWRYIHIMDGFDYTSNIYGLENLRPDKPTLIVANHPYGGPLRGQGQRIVLNHYVHEKTEKETRWLFGLDKTTVERFTRNRFVYQSSLIPVRDDKKNKETSADMIRKAFTNKDTIGINPEGDGNKTLLRAVPKSARMIILAAIHNYNIVCVATDFKDDTFFMTVDSPLGNERIREARKISKPDEDRFHQLVADYTMARIAQYLPEEKRGYYQNFQDFISQFEKLTAK